MRATYLYGAGDVRVTDAPDPNVQQPSDALVRVTRACVCGSDLHPYRCAPAGDGTSIGHEFIGVVEEIGAQVSTLTPGDFVIAPFAVSCGVCEFCRAGLQTSCLVGGFWNDAHLGTGGGQAEAVRVPLAEGTLVKVPGITPDLDEALLASLLTLSDVYATGWHAAVRGGVTAGSTVTVIGDGAVGLLAVLSATQLGAERVVLMGRYRVRTNLGRAFGATDVVAARGEEGIAAVRDLTDGGSPVVLEAVGHRPAYQQAVGVVRPGGVISRVGVPQYEEAPVGFGSLFGGNITLTGGPAPVRAYIERLLPSVLDGTVNPGRVFDSVMSLEDTRRATRRWTRVSRSRRWCVRERPEPSRCPARQCCDERGSALRLCRERWPRRGSVVDTRVVVHLDLPRAGTPRHPCAGAAGVLLARRGELPPRRAHRPRGRQHGGRGGHHRRPRRRRPPRDHGGRSLPPGLRGDRPTNVQEQDAAARPEIAGSLPDLAGYDTVMLGSGVWNVLAPMIMRTFIQSVDLRGRTVLPLVTYAVTGMGRVAEDYRTLLPESVIGEGLAVRGEEAADSRPEIEAWLRRVGLLH